MIDWTSQVLCLAGIPSGGTSAVAGVLHHLGVDMGRLMTHKERCNRAGGIVRRDYETFECQGYAEQIGMGFRQVGSYCRSRLSRPGYHGWKGSVWPLGLIECGELPIKVLRIDRDMDAVRQSRVRYGQSEGGTEINGLDKLCEQHPPICTVSYERLVESPETVVDEICVAIGLTPTEQQFLSAVGHVDPAGCHLMQPHACPA